MTYYKAVSKRGRSAGLGYPHRCSKKYSTEKWTKASQVMLRKGYGLCVFDSLEAARNEISWGKIYECEIEGLLPFPLPPLLFIEDLDAGIETPSGRYWPEGTRMCKAVKLIKEIKE